MRARGPPRVDGGAGMGTAGPPRVYGGALMGTAGPPRVFGWAYSPFQSGLRLARKASTPSLKSLDM